MRILRYMILNCEAHRRLLIEQIKKAYQTTLGRIWIYFFLRMLCITNAYFL